MKVGASKCHISYFMNESKCSRLKQCPNQNKIKWELKYTIDFVKTCSL